jgi:hypothetical protein
VGVRLPRPEWRGALGWRNGRRAALRSPWAKGSLRVRVPPPASSRREWCNMADTPSSEGGSCEFESHLPHQAWTTGARSPNGRGGGLKIRSVRVQISPRALSDVSGGRSIKVMQRIPTPRPFKRMMPVRVGPPLLTLSALAGMYANGQSGLAFNQAPDGLCGFESRHPYQFSRWP